MQKELLKSTKYEEPRSETGFVGLKNQGATCYLNSLIQLMYLTPELRTGLYSIDLDNYPNYSPPASDLDPRPYSNDVVDLDEPDAAGKGNSSAPPPPPDPKAVEALEALGLDAASITRALANHPQGTATETIVEWIFANPASEEEQSAAAATATSDDTTTTTSSSQSPASDTASGTTGTSKRVPIPLELQRMFSHLQGIDKRALSTSRLTRSFGWDGKQVFQQHDIHELNRILYDALERSLKNTPQKTLIQELYKGSWVNQIKCLNCNNIRDREEDFMDITVIADGFDSIQASLSSMVQFESMDGDNKITCDICGDKQDSLKGVTCRDAPPLLTIAQGRFTYDWSIDKRVKITSACSFPLVLDFAPYTEAGAANQPPPPPPTDKNMLNRLFEPPRDLATSPAIYDLFGVLIHSGGPYGGHYHAYIRDWLAEGTQGAGFLKSPSVNPKTFLQTAEGVEVSDERAAAHGLWFDFNDSHISPIEVSKLATQFGGKRECAYMLFYRKRSAPQLLPPGPAKSLTIPVPPYWLRRYVARRNGKLTGDRTLHDEIMNQLEVPVHVETFFAINKDTGLIESAPKGPLPALQTVTVDARMSVSEFKATVRSDYFPEELGAHDVDKLVVAYVERRGGRTVFAPLLGEPGSEKDSFFTMAQLGIADGTPLLVWDGTHLNGLEWSKYRAPITLEVQWYHSPEEITHLELPIKEDAYLTDIGSEIETLTGIPPAESLITILEAGSIRKIDVVGAVGATTTLDQARIPDRAQVAVEVAAKADGSTQSYVEASLKLAESRTKLFVLDDATPRGPGASTTEFPTYEIVVDKEDNLLTVKKHVLNALGPETTFTMDTVFFCRAQRNDSPGADFVDEALPLNKLGIGNASRIFLQAGTAPSAMDFWTVRVNEGTPSGRRLTEPVDVNIPKSSTVAGAKAIMAKLLNKEPAKTRLKVTDMFERPDRLLTDESMLLQDATSVRDDDVFWLEEGAPPVPGQIAVEVFMVVSHEDKIAAATIEHNAEQAADEKNKVYLNPIDCVLPVGPVTLNQDKPLLDAKISLIKQLKDNFGDRSESITPEQLRVWDSGKLMMDHPTLSLKKRHVVEGRSLTIQLLDAPEDRKMGSKDLLLLIRKRGVADRSYGPVKELIYQTATSPTSDSLKSALSDLMDIPVERLVVAKWFPMSGEWSPLPEKDSADSDDANAATGDVGSDAVSKKKKAAETRARRNALNLKSKPWSLRDGDMIAVKDSNDDPDDNDDWLPAAEHAFAMRHATDAAAKRAERAFWKDVESEAGKQASRRPEASLVIKLEGEE